MWVGVASVTKFLLPVVCLGFGFYSLGFWIYYWQIDRRSPASSFLFFFAVHTSFEPDPDRCRWTNLTSFSAAPIGTNKMRKIGGWRSQTHWRVPCFVNIKARWGFICMTQFVKCLMSFTEHELWTVAELKFKIINKNRPIRHAPPPPHPLHTHSLVRDLSVHVHVHTHNVWSCWWSSGSQRMEEDDGWKVFDDCVGWLLALLYFHCQPQWLPHPSVSRPLQVMSNGGRISPLSVLFFPSSWGVSNCYSPPPHPSPSPPPLYNLEKRRCKTDEHDKNAERDSKEYLSVKKNVFHVKSLLPVQPRLQTNGRLCQSWTS